MKQQILEAIKLTKQDTRNVGIWDNGCAVLQCGNKQIDINPYLSQDGMIVLQVIMASKSNHRHSLRDIMISPETMVNLAIVFNKYISEAFEDVKDELKQKGGSDA